MFVSHKAERRLEDIPIVVLANVVSADGTYPDLIGGCLEDGETLRGVVANCAEGTLAEFPLIETLSGN